jgi:hypothetical protein
MVINRILLYINLNYINIEDKNTQKMKFNKNLKEGILYSNLELKSNTHYVISLNHDPKYSCQNESIIELLKSKYNQNVEVINILSNLAPRELTENIIVLNEKLCQDHMGDEKKFTYIDPRDFNNEIQNSSYINNLFDLLTSKQKKVEIISFLNSPELSYLENDANINLLAPKSSLIGTLDDKILQRKMSIELDIPVPEGFIIENKDDFLDTYLSKYVPYFGKEAYICLPQGQGGSGSDFISSVEDYKNSKIYHGNKFLLLEKLNLKSSITSFGIIANENENIILGITEMIMDGVNYQGNIPVKKKYINEIHHYTKKIANHLGKMGYVGSYNFDFMEGDKIYFTEINPRKGGSTPEIMQTHKITNPNALELLELEYNAFIDHSFNTKTDNYQIPMVPFGVKLAKVKKGYKSKSIDEPFIPESEIFQNGGIGIYDFIPNTKFLTDGKLARVVYVPNKPTSREAIVEKLDQQIEKILK